MSQVKTNLRDRISRGGASPFVLRWLRQAYLLARRWVGKVGFELVHISYDSPIPELSSISDGYFDRADPMRGIAFDPAEQLRFLEDELAGYCREFNPARTAAQAGPHGFFLSNGTYESVDAELLYAMVRRFEPAKIIELGSGFSTLIINDALRRGETPAPPEPILHTYDPYRSPLLASDTPVTELSAQDIPDQTFSSLTDGDILFVDTSHTVKLAGDVNRIVLEILPLLAPGVIVHFHDIFLPFPYSRGHLRDAHFWTEQYLLQAFLCGNPVWEVLVGAYAVARAHPERLSSCVPSFRPGVNPGAFWIRRTR